VMLVERGSSASTTREMSFHDVSKEAIKFKQPGEILTMHLENAQLAHRQCVGKAMIENRDAVDTCALTWGEVHIRYQAWASYREPFEDSVAQTNYSKHWTRKRVQDYEKKKDLL
jgi:hypothetical protein